MIVIMMITRFKVLFSNTVNRFIYKPNLPEKEYPPIKPEEKWVKKFIVQITFIMLGRAFQSGSRHDPEIRREIAVWPENFSIMMNVFPEGPRMVLEKIHGKLKYRGSKFCERDLVINFKNLESAFMVVTAQISPAQAFAQRRIMVTGDLANAMIFTRCLNIIIAYLYPKFISKRLLKRVPIMTTKKQLTRFIIYLAGILLGYG
jgi:hypothetical protein